MYIVGLPENYINSWKDSYDKYMYICFDSKSDGVINRGWGFMPYNVESIEYFKEINFEYLGEFDLQKERKQKLKKLNNV